MKVLKRNDCLGKQVLFAAVAGTTVQKLQRAKIAFRNGDCCSEKLYQPTPTTAGIAFWIKI
jgi:hypothetical protein